MADRRSFFREFARRLVEPVAERAEKILPERAERPLLRPPGALPEDRFLDTCYRCGNCVDVCPADAIQHYRGEDEDLRGTPFIDPQHQPCVVCDGLLCMHACPSGALRPLPVQEIRMGRAVLDPASCLRTRQEDCRKCLEICPLGEKALRLDPGGQIEVLAACIGCGLCQSACPTAPAAIAVSPT